MLLFICYSGVSPPALAADAFPAKPVRVMVGTTPGSGSDLMMRLAAAKLGERWNRSVVIDNRAGALGAVAIEIAANAAPDGYTLLTLSAQNIAGMAAKRAPVDLGKSFIPVVQMVTLPYLLVVTPSLPVENVKELIALAKSRQLFYASSGTGSVVHLAMELLRTAAGVDMTHVPYKGSGQYLVDVMGGRVQLSFTNALTAMPQVRSGKLRALAISTAKRASAFPDLVTVAESGLPGFDVGSWNGVFAPLKTPDAIVAVINRDVLAATNTPEMREKISADAAEVAAPNTPAQFRALVLREISMWHKIVRTPGVRIE
jgi:tripartite-type tricarboxylate transporter receptor subunit TctC